MSRDVTCSSIFFFEEFNYILTPVGSDADQMNKKYQTHSNAGTRLDVREGRSKLLSEAEGSTRARIIAQTCLNPPSFLAPPVRDTHAKFQG